MRSPRRRLELGRARLEQGPALRRRQPAPRGLGGAGGVERAIHVAGPRERIAVRDAARARGIAAVRLPGARVELAADLERDGLRRVARATGPRRSSIHARFCAERPVGVGRRSGSGPRPAAAPARAFLGRSVLRAARRVGEVGLDVERGQEPIALGGPLGRARLEVEHVPQEVLGRRVLVEPADEIRDRAVEVLGPDHRRVEEETAGARAGPPAPGGWPCPPASRTRPTA